MRPLFHLLPACPVADRTAAAEDQSHAAFKPLTEVEIGGLYGSRSNGCGLTAGEKDIAAGFISGLGPAEESLIVGKQHVHQSKFMRRQGHFVGGHHIAARCSTDLSHVKPVGADHAALPAKRAGVHGFVEGMIAHDDLCIVIDLPRKQTGMLLVVFEIGTGFQAFFAMALNTAPCLPDSMIPGVSVGFRRHAAKRRRFRQIGVELALNGTLVPPHIARIEVLGKSVDGQSCFFRPESRLRNAVAKTADDSFGFAKHQFGVAGGFREQRAHDGSRCTEDVKAFADIVVKRRIETAVEFKLNVLGAQTFQLGGQAVAFKKRRTGAEVVGGIALCAKDGGRIGFFLQFTGKEQGKEIGAQNGDAFSFFAAENAAEL